MKLSEFREITKDMDGDLILVASIDPEGNSYGELDDHNEDYAYKDRDIGLVRLTDEYREEGYTEDDLAPDDAKPALVLWPR